jgi:hypothetical protein
MNIVEITQSSGAVLAITVSPIDLLRFISVVVLVVKV